MTESILDVYTARQATDKMRGEELFVDMYCVEVEVEDCGLCN